MPLHPQAKLLCDMLNSVPAVPSSDDTLAQARLGWGMLVMGGSGVVEPVYAVEDRDAGGVPVRVYRPSPDPDLPVIVYFHGGGWVLGTVAEFDSIVRQVANASGAIVVSVDYRLAPEHPFPAPLDDAWNALLWTVDHASEFGGDASRLAVMGDSAGGNLSAVCALRARDLGGPDIALQVLVYPACDCLLTTESFVANGKGYVLELDRMRWFFDCYTRGGTDPADPRISPLRATDLAGVAPAVVITAEYDPLRDEGELYARRLRAAGVNVESKRYDGMVHAFFGLTATFDAARDALDYTGTALRRAFGTLAN